MEEAGDCIGDLERSYGKLLGRLAKKPRYRFQPRPNNMGNFVAVVCLDALHPPMEFVGDSYKMKQVAKHSAALQALNYLELQGPESICIAETRSGSERGEVRRSWMYVELLGEGSDETPPVDREPTSLPAEPEIRNLSNAKGRLLEFLVKEVRRALYEDEARWDCDYSMEEAGFKVTLHLNVSGWAVGTFQSSAFVRKKEAEQDAAKTALRHLQKTKARRPQSLPANLRLPTDITVNTLLERYLPEGIDQDDCDIICAGAVVGGDVCLGSLGTSPVQLVVQKRQEW
ncbi:unnamed protein product [Effrenium voratum]|uniref:DRBM domain-containing protein n=1 Tax=Effrenium voratum TaxID=2562239 RepID=A0AA36IIZ6_9DINO|nr:unnamed protein product [Effrenium voratum]